MLSTEACIRAFARFMRSVDGSFALIDQKNNPVWMDESARSILEMKEGSALPQALIAALEQPIGQGEPPRRSFSFAAASDGARWIVSWSVDSGEDPARLLVLERERESARLRQASEAADGEEDASQLARTFEHDLNSPLNAMHLHLALIEISIRECGAGLAAITPAQAAKSLDALHQGIRRINEVAQAFVASLIHSPTKR